MRSRLLRAAIGLAVLVACLPICAQAAEAPATTVKLVTADVQVAADGRATRISHFQIRANNDAAIASIAQIAVPYDSSVEDIQIVDAHTLKADGRSLPVSSEAIYEQMPQVAPGMITALRMKVIVFPQFAVGDVADYTVKLSTRTALIPGQFWYADFFLHTLAIEEAHETVTAPVGYPLKVETHGDIQFSQKTEGGNVVYSWSYSRPVAAPAEVRFVSPIDSEARFFVSSFPSYAALGRAYAAILDPMMKPSPQVTALAEKITKGVRGHRDQAKAIYDWVAHNIRYLGIELGRGSMVPHDADAVIASGYGDCKDHVVLLGALLKAKGIESEGALINGGNGYTLPDVPTFTLLDHIITWIPELNLYADSSASLAPFGVLPGIEYGKPIVRVSPTSGGLDRVPPVPAGLATVSVKTESHVDADGLLSGTTSTTASGPYAVTLRAIGLSIQTLGAETAAARQLAFRGYAGAKGAFDVGSPADLSPSYTISSTFTSTGWTDRMVDSSLPLPGGLRVMDLAGDGPLGPFEPGQLKDTEPVLCMNAHMSEDISFKPQTSLRVGGKPADTDIHTPYLHFTAHWTLEDGTLRVQRDFISTTDGAICTPEIRAQNAAALKEIAHTYDTDINVQRVNGSR